MVDVCKICEHPHEHACKDCIHEYVRVIKTIGRRDKQGRLIVASGEDVPHFSEENNVEL